MSNKKIGDYPYFNFFGNPDIPFFNSQNGSSRIPYVMPDCGPIPPPPPPPPPPPTEGTVIELTFFSNTESICIAPAGIYYMDTPTFVTGSKIYRDLFMTLPEAGNLFVVAGGMLQNPIFNYSGNTVGTETGFFCNNE